MGNSYSKINFMILDKTPVNVVSATEQSDFNIPNLNGFANRLGTFWIDTEDVTHYVFRDINGKFVEFHTVEDIKP